MLQLNARRVDDGKNSDMVLLSDIQGTVYALLHMDTFWLRAGNHGPVWDALHAGDDVTLNIELACRRRQ